MKIKIYLEKTEQGTRRRQRRAVINNRILRDYHLSLERRNQFILVLKRSKVPTTMRMIDISAPIMAQVVDVDTEEDLRQQIRSLQERLQQLPTTAEVIATGTPMPVVEGTPIIAASAQRQNVKTILWVDDNPRFSTDEANFLTERGFHITNCTSTNEARKLLQEEEFDVIISDVHRVEDGQEHHDAGYQLLESPEVQESDVPFIFYLSNVSYLDQNRSETALGATDNDYGLLNLVMRAVY